MCALPGNLTELLVLRYVQTTSTAWEILKVCYSTTWEIGSRFPTVVSGGDGKKAMVIGFAGTSMWAAFWNPWFSLIRRKVSQMCFLFCHAEHHVSPQVGDMIFFLMKPQWCWARHPGQKYQNSGSKHSEIVFFLRSITQRAEQKIHICVLFILINQRESS